MKLKVWKRKLSFLLLPLSIILAAGDSDREDFVIPSAPGGMFYDSESLTFSIKHKPPGRYRILNMEDREVVSGVYRPGTLKLNPLPNGYYRIFLNDGSQIETTFSIFTPRTYFPKDKINFFALDTGLSNYPDQKVTVKTWRPNRNMLIEICRRTGVTMERERNGYRLRDNDKITKCYQKTARILSESRISPVGLLAGIPSETETGSRAGIPLRSSFQGRKCHFTVPSDLRDLYKFCRDFSEKMAPHMNYCEYGNEPDQMPDMVWDSGAAAKVAFLGFRAGNPKMRVLSSSLSKCDEAYNDAFLSNCSGAYFDIFNIHMYRWLAEYDHILRIYRRAMDKHAFSDRMLFVTENGSQREKFRLNNPSVRKPGTYAQTWEQERYTAEFFAKSLLHLRRLGVGANFLFYLPSYHEQNGEKDWGLIRTNSSARPALQVFAVFSHLLGNAEYLGQAVLPEEFTGMIFRQPDSKCTLILWRKGDLDTISGIHQYYEAYHCPPPSPVELPVTMPDGEYSVRSMFGMPMPPAKTENRILKLSLSQLPVIINNVSGLSVKPSQYKPGKIGATEDPNLDKGLVFRLIPGRGLLCDFSGIYARCQNRRAELTIEIYNFNSSERHGKLDISGVRLLSEVPEVKIAPLGKSVHVIEFEPLDSVIREGRLRISGTFSGKRTSPAVMPLRFECNFQEQIIPGAGNAKNWKPNAASPMTVTSSGTGEIDCRVKFTGKSRWIFPFYHLRQGENALGVMGISFEIKDYSEPPDARGLIYLNGLDASGKAISKTYPYSTILDHNWHMVKIFFQESPDFLKTIFSIQIGKTSQPDDTHFTIRNVKWIY